MNNILVTGIPGVGKTTLLKRLAVIFKEFNPTGFFVSEIREGDIHTGFEIENLMSETKLLAHINFKSKHAVGKFKIDIKGFDEFLETTFSKERKTGLYFVDEIGKLECESKKFCKLIHEILDSEKPLIAVIPEKGTGFISEIRKRDDVRIIELTEHNSELPLKELTMSIRDLLLE